MQDRAITDIGKLEFKRSSGLKPYQLFTEEIYPNKACKILLIEFEKDGKTISYKRIDIVNVNEENYSQYVYRKGSSRGGDITFTTKCGDLNKKLNTLIKIQFPNLIEIAKKISKNEFELFNQWNIGFLDKFEIIKADILEVYAGLTKEEKFRSAFSLSIYISNEKKLLSEFESIQKQITNDATEGKYKKYQVVSKGKNSQCSICHQKKPLIYGFGSPFKYSTVDKTGTVSGFFNQKNNWINYPICESCALEMELGKNYITKYLTNYFFGKYYYLVPKTILPNNPENLKKALSLFKEFNYDIKNSDIIVNREDYLMSKIGGLDNFFTLNLLFFEENSKKSAIQIKLMLEEIPPSRFRTLFIDVPKKINQNPLYKDVDYHFKKKQKQDLTFSFKLIKQFFEDNFYEMTYNIFMGRKISEADLYKRFMEVIRKNYKKKVTNEGFVENGELLIAKTHMLKNYLLELNLINKTN